MSVPLSGQVLGGVVGGLTVGQSVREHLGLDKGVGGKGSPARLPAGSHRPCPCPGPLACGGNSAPGSGEGPALPSPGARIR